MIEFLANHIVEHDPISTVWRTRDTVHYIQAEWSRSHDEPIDEGELLLFLCDEHRGNLTEEQKSLARRCRDEMRTAYGAAVFRLMLCEEMLNRGMAADFRTCRSIFSRKEATRHGCQTGRYEGVSPRGARQRRKFSPRE